MKISVVTINYNNAHGLQKTIDSVAAQTYKEFEHIIVDGNSHDEGVRIIQDYDYAQRSSGQPHPVIRWTSEIDKGIYNAMNKGVRMAQGEYVLMLNSGDTLVDERVLERIISELDGTDIVQGNTIEEHDGKRCQNKGYGRSEISMCDIIQGKFLHQASFCRRDLFERYGYFDDSYAIVADKKFFINCLGFHDASFKYVDIDVANFDVNGISSATEGPWYVKHEEEYKRMLNELFPKRLKAYMEESREFEELRKHSWISKFTKFLLKIA
jgi:glycosyltransferase involved in cell wall biosynthesis